MPQKRNKVLFLDDDKSFLDVLKSLMASYARDAWEIFAATDTGQALAIIQEQQLDLLVVDVHMPVVDGLQFLSLIQRKYPNILKVVLTGDASEHYRAACLSNGAELFLGKPATAEGWQSVYSTLSQLIRFQPEEGFRGVLRRVGLQDVLQMECLARHSLCLEVSTQSVQGVIVVREGEIIHAEAGGRVGEEAFNYLMSLKGGEFHLRPFAEPPTRSITGSWEFLLMEAARKVDEARGEAVEDGSGATAEPDAAVAGADAAALPRSDETGLASKPQIDEVLVCSIQGDVLYEWQCRDANKRVSFLEFLSQKARQLGQGLPLGEFERLEIQGTDSRVLAQIQQDRAMLVRSSQAPTERTG